MGVKMKTDKIRRIVNLYFVAMLLLLSTALFSFEKEIKAMSATLSDSIVAAGKKNIAVVDFTDLQGNVTELGRFFAEEFSGTLASAGKGFKIIDRTHLKTLLIEHKLSTTGIIDPQTVQKLGQIAGVDSLIAGTITPFGDTIRLSVKVLETNTAMVIGAASEDIAKTKAIEELLGKGIGESNQASNTKNISTGPGTQLTVIKPILKVESNGFVFDLLSCRMSGTTIICDFKVTNIGKDQRLSISAGERTLIIDENGNEISSSYVQFGKNESTSDVSNNLATDIPIKARLKFDKIDPAINQLSLLEISCYVGPYSSFLLVQFRNVPISK